MQRGVWGTNEREGKGVVCCMSVCFLVAGRLPEQWCVFSFDRRGVAADALLFEKCYAVSSEPWFDPAFALLSFRNPLFVLYILGVIHLMSTAESICFLYAFCFSQNCRSKQ